MNNPFMSDHEIVGVAYEKRDDTISIVSIFTGAATDNESGAGNWQSVELTTNMTRLDGYIQQADRYMAGRPRLQEGLYYLFALTYDVILNHQQLTKLTAAIVGSGQALSAPIPELAAALKTATEKVVVNMTIKFKGAERRAHSLRADGKDPLNFTQSILLSEAGVQACCRAFGWRVEGPFHQGEERYTVVFYPGDQKGAAIAGMTDRQMQTQKDREFTSFLARGLAVDQATEGWEKYMVKA